MESAQKTKKLLNSRSLDRALDIASIFFLVLLWVLTLFSYWKLPDTIVTHFNASGKIDGYGSKNLLFVLPVFGTIIYTGFSVINRYSRKMNHQILAREPQARTQYVFAIRLLRLLKLFLLIIFSLLTLYTYLGTTGVSNGLGRLFLPIVIAFLLIPFVMMIIRFFRSDAAKD